MNTFKNQYDLDFFQNLFHESSEQDRMYISKLSEKDWNQIKLWASMDGILKQLNESQTDSGIIRICYIDDVKNPFIKSRMVEWIKK